MNVSRRHFSAITILTLLTCSGCGYGTVSPKTYQLATAIYGVCNRQQSDKLPELYELIDESLDADEITRQEAEWLNDILKQAEQGEWETATKAARRMMEDQVE